MSIYCRSCGGRSGSDESIRRVDELRVMGKMASTNHVMNGGIFFSWISECSASRVG